MGMDELKLSGHRVVVVISVDGIQVETAEVRRVQKVQAPSLQAGPVPVEAPAKDLL